MGTFTQIGISETIFSKDKSIQLQIVKFKKDNTERIFFAPRLKGKALNGTMFSSLNDARNLAKNYINFKKSNW